MDTRYMYQVNTRLPINLSVGCLRVPKSVELTKEDVQIALGKAVLFRRFPDRIERVNSDNMDRLHNEKFMTEEEYEEFLNNTANEQTDDSRGRVDVPVTPKEVVPEVKVEETAKAEPVVEATPVVETPVEEVKEDITTNEDILEASTETSQEAQIEELEDKIELVDDIDDVVFNDDSGNTQPNYQKKNKKHH